MKAQDVTDEMFDDELTDLVGATHASTLLSIEGVYEILSEHFNNQVLENLGVIE